MNIHLPAILMFTRGTRFWHTAICSSFVVTLLDSEARPRCWQMDETLLMITLPEPLGGPKPYVPRSKHDIWSSHHHCGFMIMGGILNVMDGYGKFIHAYQGGINRITIPLFHPFSGQLAQVLTHSTYDIYQWLWVFLGLHGVQGVDMVSPKREWCYPLVMSTVRYWTWP